MTAEAHFRAVAPQYMRKLMADFPLLSKLDAAAIFGNLGHESLGFTALQEIKPTVKGSKGGTGWAQWTGPRRRSFESYCTKHGLDPKAADTNYAYLFRELTGGWASALPETMHAKTLDDKVRAFELHYEGAGIKHYDRRNAWAVIALDALEKAGPAPIPANRPAVQPPLSSVPPYDELEPSDAIAPPRRPNLIDLLGGLFRRNSRKETTMATNSAVVDVQSSWASKINWTQALGLIFVVATMFGIPVSEELKAQIIALGSSLLFIVTWYLRTFVSKSVTPTVAKKL